MSRPGTGLAHDERAAASVRFLSRASRPKARDNARPAAAEWGSQGSPRSRRVGFGAQPRFKKVEWGTRGPRVAVAWGPGRSPV